MCDLMARLRNKLASALNSEKQLPKAIVVVLDNNLIKYANYPHFGMSLLFSRLMHYIFSEFNKLIQARKDYLPKKSIRADFPHVLWIVPPFHSGFSDNSQLAKFGKALDTTAVLYPNMWALKLKKIWSPEDTSLYLQESARFTATGLMSYWMAVDRTVKFWDTALVTGLMGHKNPGQSATAVRKPSWTKWSSENNKNKNRRYYDRKSHI